MQDPTSAPTGATCALHPEAPAHAICVRCGNFMCATCSENGQYDACPSCRGLEGGLPGLQSTRDNIDLDELVTFSWNHFKRDWVMVCAAVLVYLAVAVGLGFVGQIFQAIGAAIGDQVGAIAMSFLFALPQGIVQAVLTGGLFVVLYDVMRGGQVDVARIFSQFSNFRPYATAVFAWWGMGMAYLTAMVLVLGLPLLFFIDLSDLDRPPASEDVPFLIAYGVVAFFVAILPAIWLFLPYQFMEQEIAIGGEKSGVEVIRRSFALAKGKRWWTIAIILVTALFGFIGVLACCVGIIPAFALILMLRLVFYVAIRRGSPLPPLPAVPRA